VKINFLLFVLDLTLHASPSGLTRNTKELCKSYLKAACAFYKQLQDCMEGILVTPNPQGTLSHHCLLKLHNRLFRVCLGSKRLWSDKAWESFWRRRRGGRDLRVMIAILPPPKFESWSFIAAEPGPE